MNKQTFSAGMLVIATGAWSGQFAETLELKQPIYPQCGQIMHMQGPEEASRKPIVVCLRSHYTLTFPSGRVAARATQDHHAGFEVCETAGSVHEVLSEALRQV